MLSSVKFQQRDDTLIMRTNAFVILAKLGEGELVRTKVTRFKHYRENPKLLLSF